MFRWFLLLLIVSPAFAETVAPTIYEQRDLGIPSKEEFTYSISVDCTAAAIRVYVMDESNHVVEGADSYLKYIDFSQPLISTGETDKDGFVLHKLPGNVRLMRGFFVLVVQKTNYRSKEIHFDINRCWSDEPVPQPPVPDTPSTPPQNTSEPPETTPPENNDLPPEIPDVDNESNSTATGTEKGGGVCAGVLGLLMLFKFFRGKKSS